MQTVSDVPRKGNVDRNTNTSVQNSAWTTDVPRKGNVDRNKRNADECTRLGMTFPARGTWIEIPQKSPIGTPGLGRSPQGERG